jgi:hypothetical protein
MAYVRRAAMAAWAVAALGAAIDAQSPDRCRIDGRIASGGTPLPGVSIVVSAGHAPTTGRVTAIVQLDGRYSLLLAAGGATASQPRSRDCRRRAGFDARRGFLRSDRRRRAHARTARDDTDRDGGGGATAPRFQTLNVEPTAAAPPIDTTPPAETDDAARLLPPDSRWRTRKAMRWRSPAGTTRPVSIEAC